MTRGSGDVRRHHPKDFDLGLTWKQRDRMAALRRRQKYLAEWLAGAEGYEPDPGENYDRAELSALNWAIRIIENAAMADVLKEVE